MTLVIYSGDPYPNGRNQESSAEAIAAYEAVALYGLGASSVFGDSEDPADKVGPLYFFCNLRECCTTWLMQDIVICYLLLDS